jgi:hypothetical protein
LLFVVRAVGMELVMELSRTRRARFVAREDNADALALLSVIWP